MGIVGWIVLGALAGWLAGMITGNRDRGCVTNIVVGIGGALFAGAAHAMIFGEDYLFTFNLPSLIVATLGAIVLLAIINLAAPRS